jgi:hypothetical protein
MVLAEPLDHGGELAGDRGLAVGDPDIAGQCAEVAPVRITAAAELRISATPAAHQRRPLPPGRALVVPAVRWWWSSSGVGPAGSWSRSLPLPLPCRCRCSFAVSPLPCLVLPAVVLVALPWPMFLPSWVGVWLVWVVCRGVVAAELLDGVTSGLVDREGQEGEVEREQEHHQRGQRELQSAERVLLPLVWK